MNSHNQGATQELTAAKRGISVRSAQHIDKGQRQPVGHHRWRTCKDLFAEIRQSLRQPIQEQQPALAPITMLEYLQDAHPDLYPGSVLRTLQRRINT